jgi:hypothetical protein
MTAVVMHAGRGRSSRVRLVLTFSWELIAVWYDSNLVVHVFFTILVLIYSEKYAIRQVFQRKLLLTLAVATCM